MKKHPKILELQKRDLPISYNSLAVDASGKLSKRKNLLDDGIVEGYGVIWGSRNDYGEKFVKGCFAKSIQDHGPDSTSAYKLKFRNEHGKVCGLFDILREDEIGLYFRTVKLDDVSWANELLIQLRSGSINNFSIGFKHVWDKIEWEDSTDSMINKEARLWEISAVGIPSDIETFAIRSAEDQEFITEEVEEFINELPKDKRLEARKIITRCMTLANRKPLEESRNALIDKAKPPKSGLDLNYLTKNFSLK